MGSTWGPPGSGRPQMGPILAPWTLLFGMSFEGRVSAHLHTGTRSSKELQWVPSLLVPCMFQSVIVIYNRWFSMFSTKLSSFSSVAYFTKAVSPSVVNTLRPIQHLRHFADDISNCIFFNENVRVSLNISLRFVPKVRNIPPLVQIMA